MAILDPGDYVCRVTSSGRHIWWLVDGTQECALCAAPQPPEDENEQRTMITITPENPPVPIN